MSDSQILEEDATIDVPERRPDWGVVTFLDILGWKGIHSRNPDPLKTLHSLIDGIKKAQEKTRGSIPDGYVITVTSISDTIVISTVCDKTEATKVIEAHGILCAWAIPYSIANGVPVRGATSAGGFKSEKNAFVGKAIDEAASWHDQSDWIGVHLTPSAEFVFNPLNKESLWVQYELPNKIHLKWSPYCVNWTSGWIDRTKMLESIKEELTQMGPIVPEIAGKFINTLSFINKKTSRIPSI